MSTCKSVAVFSSIDGLLRELRKVLPLVKFVEIDVKCPDPNTLKKSEIILADSDLVAPRFYDLPNTKWVQGTWAGIDKITPYVKPEKPINLTYSRLSGDNFGQLMGEYVISNIVSYERNLFQVGENQKNKAWIPQDCPRNHRSLNELTVGILGSGAIGSRIGRYLKTFGSTVYTCGRRQTISLDCEETRYIEKYYPSSELPAFLGHLDYLVNVLPSTRETCNILGGNVLENCAAKGTIFINIGRGTAIKEAELVTALEKKWISGAILDVFEKEPLLKESLLWSMPNVFITPHISGYSRPQDIALAFKKNYELYEKNLPLEYVVDFTKGY